MLKINKRNLELNIIPMVMLILSIVIGITGSEIVIKVITLISAILLGMQIQKIIDKINEG